jgi:hypothetical protein
VDYSYFFSFVSSLGPINMAVRMIYKAMSPLMPARLLSKIHLVDNLTSHMAGSIVPAEYFSEPHPSFLVEEDGETNFSISKMMETQLAEGKKRGFLA